MQKFYSVFHDFYRWVWKLDTQKQLVDVKILQTNWIFRCTNNIDDNDLFMLINLLNNQPSDALFNTEFVTVLVEEFWDLYQTAIFIVVCAPFML